MFGKRCSCIVIPSEVEGSFWHTGMASYVRQRKMGMLLRKEQERAEWKEDFPLRPLWRYGGMGLFHVAYNGYVWKALFLYRHPDRSGGIFLAHWYSVLCETAEKGNPSAKEARKSGVRGIFLAALEMTVWCISPYVWRRKRGNLLRRKQERAECKEDFSTAPLMTVGKAADSMNLSF